MIKISFFFFSPSLLGKQEKKVIIFKSFVSMANISLFLSSRKKICPYRDGEIILDFPYIYVQFQCMKDICNLQALGMY